MTILDSKGDKLSNLVAHLERFLGPISAGWSKDWEGNPLSFQVAQFDNCMGPSTVGLATLGVGRQALQSRTSNKLIHQEFFMAKRGGAEVIPGLLQQICRGVISSGQALLRGQVLGPRNPITSSSLLTAIYVAIPVYLPDEFGSVRDFGNDLVISWLVPITSSEARFVDAMGWGKFEDILVENDPDLLDFSRESMKLV